MNNFTCPMVSVCMITYNHELFIKDAIESVLAQKCTFPVELVIGEDSSTDNTRNICIDYTKKFPNIKLLPTHGNIGMVQNLIRTLQSCTGKYIAINEGDDYWIDPHKLQKQVDFLEKNAGYSITFHASEHLWIKTNEKKNHRYKCKNGFRKFTIKDVINHGGGFMTTNSMLFRSEFIKNLPEWFLKSPTGDFPISLMLSSKGEIAYFDDLMSVYRRGISGSWSERSQSKSDLIELTCSTEKMLLSFNKYTSYNYLIPIYLKIFKNRLDLFYNNISSGIKKIWPL